MVPRRTWEVHDGADTFKLHFQRATFRPDAHFFVQIFSRAEILNNGLFQMSFAYYGGPRHIRAMDEMVAVVNQMGSMNALIHLKDIMTRGASGASN